MSDPVLENRVAVIVNGVLKQLIEGAGEDVVKASLLVTYPFLGLPFIKQIFELILDQASKEIYVQAAHIATKIVIDIQVKQEASGVNQAFENLQMAMASGDSNAIAIASADLSVAYGALIHSDGSATP